MNNETSEEQVNNDKLNEMIEEIRPELIKNYDKYLNIDIEHWEFTTKKDRKIEDIEILAANKIIEEMMDKDEAIDLWKINVMQYATAVTLLARHVKLREIKNTHPNKKENTWLDNEL